MEQAKLKKILEKHEKWLNTEEGGERADLSGANLNCADLSYAILNGANLNNANLNGADLNGASLINVNLKGAKLGGAILRDADLRWANLGCADLSYAILIDANLNQANLHETNLNCANLKGTVLGGADLSGATGLLNSIDYLSEKFERTKDGYIVYKVFNGCYKPPEKWKVELGEVITEEVNFCRTDMCGCGINVAPLEWVKNRYPKSDIYKLLIRWEWLAGVVVPYNTDGKIRCARAQIVGKV